MKAVFISVFRERDVREGRRSVAGKTPCGFTLIELLVAMAVTALLSSLAFSVSAGFLASWGRTIGRVGMETRARAILDQAAADLQAAVMRDDGRVGFAATALDRSDNSGLWQTTTREKPPGRLQLVSEHLDDLRFGQAGVWLRFFTSVRGTNDDRSRDSTAQTLSAPVAVAYQLVRRVPVGTNDGAVPRYCLHRSAVRPAQVAGRSGTLEAGYDLDPSTSAYGQAAAGNDGTMWGDPYSVRCPAAVETLWSENVVDFGVRLWVRDEGGELQLIFPATSGDVEHLGCSFSGNVSSATRYPEIVEIVVRLVSDEGARQLALLETGQLGSRPLRYASDAEWWWGITEAHSRVFSQRVEILAQSR